MTGILALHQYHEEVCGEDNGTAITHITTTVNPKSFVEQLVFIAFIIKNIRAIAYLAL